ncbi:MAG: prolyl oligopeptidase family serine peptidase [Planctomycetota bacterium]
MPIALLLGISAPAQSPWFAGDWAGVVAVPGNEVALRLHVDEDRARFSVPHFGWHDLPATLHRRGKRVEIILRAYADRATVLLAPSDGALRGEWRGWGASAEVELRRCGPPRLVSEELTFRNDGHSLPGTLLLPRGDGPFPAIVWTHGSGRITRDDPIYRGLAVWMVEQGIASLIYDKRPPHPGATMQVLGADAAAGVDALRAHPRILPGAVGVGGLSQGGWVAPIAAASSDRIAFVVGLSAPGISPAAQNLFNQRNKVLDAGFGTAAADEASRTLESIYAYLRTGQRRDDVWRELEQRRTEPWFEAAYELPIWHRRGLPPAPWEHRAALDFDPATVWRRVTAPVVCVWGSEDRVVPPEKSQTQIGTWLDQAGNARRLLAIIPEASHDLRALASTPWTMGALPARMNAVARFVRSLVETRAEVPLATPGDDAYQLHGATVPDPFRWLAEANEATEAWAKAQDQATRGAFADDPRVTALRQRILELNEYRRAPVPRAAGGRQFSLQREPGGIYGSLHVLDNAGSRLLVDPHEHPASPESSMAIGQPVPSPDGRYVLYGASSQAVPACLRVVEVAGADDLVADTVSVQYWPWRVSWLADSSGFAYAEGATVRIHRLGTPVNDDPVVFRAAGDPPPHLGVQAAADGSLLFVTAYSRTENTTEVHTVDWTSGGAPARLLAAPVADYRVLGKRGRRVFTYTTHQAPNGRVIAVDLDRPDPSHWLEIVPEHSAAVMDGNHPIRASAGLFGDRLALLYVHEGQLLVRVHQLSGELVHEITNEGFGFNESGLIGAPGRAVVRYDLQSMFDPGSAYELDLHTGVRTLLGRAVTPFDASDFESTRIRYTSHDGTVIPMFLAHRRDLVRDGTHAVLIRNGAVGGGVPRPLYLPELHAWVEAGGVLALPSARGSGEYGEAWHRAGAGPNKITCIDDLAAAAHWLVQSGYSRADGVGLYGASASGAASAGVLLRHPDSFGAGLLPIPRIDLLSSYTRIDEYGDPRDEEHFDRMLEWMPLANTSEQIYPPLLVQVGSVDKITPPYHGYKLVAALQAAQQGSAPVHLQVAWDVGHAQGIGVAHRSETLALQYAFLARSLGLGER